MKNGEFEILKFLLKIFNQLNYNDNHLMYQVKQSTLKHI